MEILQHSPLKGEMCIKILLRHSYPTLLPHFYRISRTPAGSNANSSAFPFLFVTSQILNLIHSFGPFFPSHCKCPNQHINTTSSEQYFSTEGDFDPQRIFGKVGRHFFFFVRTGDRVLLTSKGYRTGMLPNILQSPGQPPSPPPPP